MFDWSSFSLVMLKLNEIVTPNKIVTIDNKIVITRLSHLMQSVDQAGSERTEAGESALPAEESPQPGRAKRKL